MARKKKIWRPLFEGTFIGPVQIKNARTPSQNFEAKCHRCSWASYPGTNEEARDILLLAFRSDAFQAAVASGICLGCGRDRSEVKYDYVWTSIAGRS